MKSEIFSTEIWDFNSSFRDGASIVHSIFKPKIVSWMKPLKKFAERNKSVKRTWTEIVIPFRVSNKLVTRRNASRGDLLKNFGGVMLGGSVVGFLDAVASHALIEPWCNRSKCSVEAVDLVCRCFGYHPRAGKPETLISSPLACSAWLMLRWCCRPVLPIVVQPENSWD